MREHKGTRRNVWRGKNAGQCVPNASRAGAFRKVLLFEVRVARPRWTLCFCGENSSSINRGVMRAVLVVLGHCQPVLAWRLAQTRFGTIEPKSASIQPRRRVLP